MDRTTIYIITIILFICIEFYLYKGSDFKNLSSKKQLIAIVINTMVGLLIMAGITFIVVFIWFISEGG